MSEDLRPVCYAGGLIDAWLSEHGRSQQWLIAEINRLREARGLKASAAGASLWRWRVGDVQPGINNATIIEEITGVAISAWATFAAPSDLDAPGDAAADDGAPAGEAA
jgi:hypothetical protein